MCKEAIRDGIHTHMHTPHVVWVDVARAGLEAAVCGAIADTMRDLRLVNLCAAAGEPNHKPIDERRVGDRRKQVKVLPYINVCYA